MIYNVYKDVLLKKKYFDIKLADYSGIGLTKNSKNFEKIFFSKLIFYDLQCIKRCFIEKNFFGL